MDFSDKGLHRWLDSVDDTALERLDYGVIGFDNEGKTCRYSEREAQMAGLKRGEVLGRVFFTEIARCMNNGLVAGRFDEARSNGETLDATIDYVLAFRSMITPVRLRLLSDAGGPLSYLLVQRLVQAGK